MQKVNEGSCNHDTGNCQCNCGWKGRDCSEDNNKNYTTPVLPSPHNEENSTEVVAVKAALASVVAASTASAMSAVSGSPNIWLFLILLQHKLTYLTS